MGWGTGNLGGGSGGLNFKVVGYATEAELLADTPKENTIGIITTNKITGWLFSATEPESPAEGMVWISTGSSSDVEFNALKKNGIQVYPLSAKQYVSGAWVDVTAMSYQGGEWVVFDPKTYLYRDGDQCTDISGGWRTSGNGGQSGVGTVTFGSTSMTQTNSGATYSTNLIHNTAIDLTNVSTIGVVIKATTQDDTTIRVVKESIPLNSGEYSASAAAGSVGEHVLDVSSLTGTYRIKLHCYGSGDYTVGEVWYE